MRGLNSPINKDNSKAFAPPNDQRRSDLTALEREIAAQREALAEESTRLQAAAANVLTLEQDRAALDALMQAQRQDQAELESAKQEYLQRSAALDARESELAQRQSEITQEIEQLANSETQYAELTRQKDEAVARADRLEEQLADATARLDKLAELASRGLAAPEEQVAQTEPVSPYANIDFGDYHAILIGNQDYHNENWVGSSNPAQGCR